MPAIESRSFSFATPSSVIALLASCVCGTIAYVVASLITVVHEAFTFIVASVVLSIATELLCRTRVRFEGDILVVRKFGYVGPTTRFLLQEIHSVRFGAVNGEALVQFGYEQREERLGPWWGYNRKALDRNVKKFGRELELACTSQS